MSLLESVQGLLERTYAIRNPLGDVGRFVIGDRGLRLLYGPEEKTRSAGAAGGGARVLLRETAHGVRACIYYPDELIACLERYPPQRGLGQENVDAFATLVEELDHLLLLAARARQRRALTLFELELQANVSKHLVLTRFLAGQGRPSATGRLWLRHQLFEKGRFCDDDPQVRARYRDAARWAVRFLDGLGRLEFPRRLRKLREFHAASSGDKVALIDRL